MRSAIGQPPGFPPGLDPSVFPWNPMLNPGAGGGRRYSIANGEGLPPAQGNIYYVDNIKFGPLREKSASLPQLMLLLGDRPEAEAFVSDGIHTTIGRPLFEGPD